MDDIVRVEDYGESDPSEDLEEGIANKVPERDTEDYDLNNYKGIYFNDEPGSKF